MGILFQQHFFKLYPFFFFSSKPTASCPSTDCQCWAITVPAAEGLQFKFQSTFNVFFIITFFFPDYINDSLLSYQLRTGGDREKCEKIF